MSQRWRAIAGAAGIAGLALLAGCREAPAQRRMHSVDTHGGHRVEMTAYGDVEFTDDDRDVARLSSDGRLTIEEARRGGPDRRVEFRPAADGGIRRLYFEDGEPRTPDAEDRAWIERMILQAVRNHGIGAERRVARIRARQGVDGVLREIEQIGGDGGKRHYYVTLLRSSPRLRGEEAVRTFRHLAREIDSDGEKRYTLVQALEHAPPGPAELAALLEAAGTIDSDGERAYLLVRVARDDALADARVRQAFFRAADGISSDGELARVLVTVLRREGVRDEVVAAAVRSSEEISSDGERARVLVSVPQRSLRSRAVRAAFERSMHGIDSDGERARVARWLAAAAT